MFVTGPDVIKTVTHEDVTKEELAPLAKRLRPLVEARVPTAGPGNDCPLDSSDSYLSTFLR
jgi:hypothetical protein